MADRAKIIPAVEARTIYSCGPLGCPFYSIGRERYRDYCSRTGINFSDGKGASFPAWCPLEDFIATEAMNEGE